MTKKDMLNLLHKEEPVLRAEITALYSVLDHKLGLHGADVPITFGMDEKALGSYLPPSYDNEEQFQFSLFFIGFCMNNQLTKADRVNLYKHEYAHYMTRHISIPEKYNWQPGVHGSAWKYCCSLIGAIPADYYIEDASIQKIDYDSVLERPSVDHKQVQMLDTYRTQKMYANMENAKIKYEVGDVVTHPKFGEGTVQEIEQQPASVRLHIAFGDEIKIIDQKWLVKTGYKKVAER
ncbi:hypothetical protein SAMN05421493_13018 [Pseudobutyrivibrio sp. 49]|uniref:hypothetical protein n=1 Tax=unclassified Pseudobutyrivibrio TaxID=2638619 RepID=UPI00088B61B0|nr:MULTISPECIES: hypothetical protein [unclassified Pseudobutyrivibrio]SDI82473.1 hypothetical protein SAMN05421493_13018 [Pseudobutyrivibrio sp. 49]SFN59928.1 hypothetical protein SAMN04487831_10285 [Pseudobutyrivibrio sp. UC1225]